MVGGKFFLKFSPGLIKNLKDFVKKLILIKENNYFVSDLKTKAAVPKQTF